LRYVGKMEKEIENNIEFESTLLSTPRQRLIDARLLDSLVEPQVESEEKDEVDVEPVVESDDEVCEASENMKTKPKLISSISDEPVNRSNNVPTTTITPDDFYEFEENVLSCSVTITTISHYCVS
jgi:hypothetical protein